DVAEPVHVPGRGRALVGPGVAGAGNRGAAALAVSDAQDVGAVVGVVREAVEVDVVVLADVTHAVGVGVRLVRVRVRPAVVAHAVAVRVLLERIVLVGTVVVAAGRRAAGAGPGEACGRDAVTVDVVEVVLAGQAVHVAVTEIVLVVDGEHSVAAGSREQVVR